jgi:hypothetical protein
MPGLTLAQLTTVTRSTRAHQRKVKFVDTLKLNSYAGLDEFIYTGKSKSVGGTAYEERIRMRPNTGATRGVRLYQVTSSQKAPPPVTMSVPYVYKENKGIVFDGRERQANKGTSDEQIIDSLNVERSANYEDIANHLESDIWNAPESSSDDLSFWGLPTWLRPSMNSGGTFVADTTGGFNGTYIRYRDASVSATLASIDASTVANERWRNWVATRSAGMSVDLARLIRNACSRTSFKPLRMLKGDQQTGDCVIFMNQSDHEGYLDLVNNGPDDRDGDLFPFSEVKINGVRIIKAAQLDSDTTNSIYGCRLNQWAMLKLPGYWMKESDPIQKDGAHNVYEIPIDIAGNLMTNNPRGAGWRIHGSF